MTYAVDWALKADCSLTYTPAHKELQLPFKVDWSETDNKREREEGAKQKTKQKCKVGGGGQNCSKHSILSTENTGVGRRGDKMTTGRGKQKNKCKQLKRVYRVQKTKKSQVGKKRIAQNNSKHHYLQSEKARRGRNR